MSTGAIPLRSASGATSTPARESHNGPKDRVIKKRPQRSLARDQSHTSIHVLPDGVLLDIFDFCRTERGGGVFRKHTNLEWQLVRVCRRWRYLIFASPSRLDLKLLCTHGTPVRKALDCWPAFPIIIEYDNVSQKDEDNIIAALGGHPDRVRRIRLCVAKSSWEKIRTSMRKPFPALTHLCLETKDRDPDQVVSLPRKFLGDRALRLEEVYLRGISFSAPSLLTYLLSASDLINLQILEMPHTNFISLEVMVTALARLTRLETLAIEFRHPLPRSERRLSPPAIPIVRFPVLSSFKFRGFCDYLEDLVAQIDAPRVTCCNIWYFSQPMYQVPQFSRFLGRTEYFKPPWLSRAQIEFVERWMGMELDVGDNDEARGERVPCDPEVPGVPHLNIRLISEGMAREALHSIQVLHQLSSSLANVVDLTICGPADGPLFPKYANGLFFRRADVRRSPAHFAAVRPVGRCSMANCCSPDRDSIDHIELARAPPTRSWPWSRCASVGSCPRTSFVPLEWVEGEMAAQVLPALRVLYLEDPSISVQRFISVRQNAGRAVVVNLSLPDPDPDQDQDYPGSDEHSE